MGGPHHIQYSRVQGFGVSRSPGAKSIEVLLHRLSQYLTLNGKYIPRIIFQTQKQTRLSLYAIANLDVFLSDKDFRKIGFNKKFLRAYSLTSLFNNILIFHIKGVN